MSFTNKDFIPTLVKGAAYYGKRPHSRALINHNTGQMGKKKWDKIALLQDSK